MTKRSLPSPKRSAAPPASRTHQSHAAAIRETIESVAIAFVLAFLFRTFEAEAFVIPTGSMAERLKFGGFQIGFVQTATWNINRYVPVNVTLTPSGQVTVLVDGTNVFGTVTVPYVPITGRFGLYARTGGSLEAHWVDNLSYTFTTLDTGRDPDFGGVAIYGNAYLDLTSGVSGSGALHLTDNVNNQAGSMVIPELTPGFAVQSFNASFKLRIGNGSGNAADGFSFNLAGDLPDAATGATAAEEGLGTGLSVCVDNYPTGGTDSPSFKLKLGGVLLGFIKIPKWNSPNYIPVSLNLDADGTLDVVVDGTNVVSNLAIPYAPVAGRFGLFARTGGENQTHWIDDLVINVTTPGHNAAFANNFDVGPGTVSLTGGVVTYTSPANTCGLDRFYYVASDGQVGGTTIGEVVVTLPEVNPQPPVIVTWCSLQSATARAGTNCSMSTVGMPQADSITSQSGPAMWAYGTAKRPTSSGALSNAWPRAVPPASSVPSVCSTPFGSAVVPDVV
jgi:hypothetical protein